VSRHASAQGCTKDRCSHDVALRIAVPSQINGFPASPAEKWNVVIDGGAKVQAKRNTVIHVGDTIYLRYE